MSIFGCSSGGLATLSLVAHHPELARCGIIHEVPFECPPPLAAMKELSDEKVAAQCKEFFATQFSESKEKWDALGMEYHERLEKNYVTWVRHVVNIAEDAGRREATPENLTKRPIFWTVGSLNEGIEHEEGFWKLNFELAKEAGLEVNKTALECLHFPAVSIPEDTAKWIDQCIRQIKD